MTPAGAAVVSAQPVTIRRQPTTSRWTGLFGAVRGAAGLLHATGGQGRAELILPPRAPEQLPVLVEYDRTLSGM
ncbi:hypothetical protein GCM10010440_39490 [Kitasatospora cinereorecta]